MLKKKVLKLFVIMLIVCMTITFIPKASLATISVDSSTEYAIEFLAEDDVTFSDVTNQTFKINYADGSSDVIGFEDTGTSVAISANNHEVNASNTSVTYVFPKTQTMKLNYHDDMTKIVRSGFESIDPEEINANRVIDQNDSGFAFSVSKKVTSPTPPAPPTVTTVPLVEDAIWFELCDDLGNTLTYSQYHEIHDEWMMKIGATIEYSYDKTTWNELSNFDQDTKLTEATYQKGTMPKTTYCFENDVVYIRFTKIVAGTSQGTGKRLEADFTKTADREIKVNTIYTFNQKNKTYSVSYDNGIRSLDWIYDMGIRDDAKEDMLVTNGIAKIIKIGNMTAEEYIKNHGTILDPNGKEVPAFSGNTENGGYWRLTEGTKVTVQLVPEYGYQIASSALNGIGLIPNDDKSTFTFEIPQSQLHFSAMFTKVDDKINVTAQDVESGSISGAENIVSTGNLELNVGDLDISEDKKAEFEDKAGEGKILQYLNLNLYNIVYKTADGSEVWSDQLEELNEEITVVLKMSDDFVAEDGTYYIIREHKGEYEELEAVYDKETNTLTFKTDRFSDYAIAVKTNDNGIKDDSPKTGDTVMIYVYMLVIASFGSCIIIGKKLIAKRK